MSMSRGRSTNVYSHWRCYVLSSKVAQDVCMYFHYEDVCI